MFLFLYSLRDLLKALNRLGVSDVRVIIINSKDSSLEDDRLRLIRAANVSSITVYQETESAPVWDDLEGLKGDIFVYDKCGRMTYYLPTPLSIVSAERPFVQTSVLSTYFDKPCGEFCEDRRVVFSTEPTIIVSDSGNSSVIESIDNFENRTIDIQSTPRDNDTALFSTASNVTKVDETSEISNGSGLLSGPWKIFDFFLAQVSPTEASNISSSLVSTSDNLTTVITRETKTLQTNYSSSSGNQSDNQRALNETGIEESSVMQPSLTSNDTREGSETSGHDTNETLTSKEGEEVSLTSTLPPIQCDAHQCRDFSTDSVLRARLCCLREDVGNDGEPVMGCRSFSKDTCSQMLPLIKCCLKDFKELLANYFSSVTNGRKRKPSFPG